MIVTVRYKAFSGIAPLHKHELLRNATVDLSFTFPDGHHEYVPMIWDSAKSEWRGSTTSAQANAPAMELDYAAKVPWKGNEFQILRIIQAFTLVAVPADLPPGTRAVTPAGWVYIKPGGRSVLRTVPRALHPLLELSGLYAPILTINALMTDITDLWREIHAGSSQISLRDAMADPRRNKVRVLAHLGGIPYVWFASIPKAAEESNEVSPHVFFMPGGFGAVAYEPDTIAGLAAPDHDSDIGRRVVNNFILDPIADDDFSTVSPKIADDGVPGRAGLFRNVINVSRRASGGLLPNYWILPMGMNRAFFQSGVSQVLFVPLRRKKFGLGRAQTAALQDMLEAAMQVLWSQSESIATEYSKPLTIGKTVLSGWSDGGVALWDAAMTNITRLKGVIAVEVQNTNVVKNEGGTYLGKHVIAKLVANEIPVVLVGRHKMANYDPQVAEEVRKKLRRIPDDTSGPDQDGLEKVSYEAVFAYPPDITRNHFMIYRTYRLWETERDFLMRNDAKSKQAIADLKARILEAKKVPGPVVYQELIDAIFTPELVEDDHGRFFHHHFALNGGRKFKLPPLDSQEGYYNVAVTYKTFLQEALELIG